MSEYQETYEIENTGVKTQRYAGFWMRFWAYLFDLVIVFSINGILLSPFKFIGDGSGVDIGFWTVAGIVGLIVLYLYFLLMTKFYGKTLGKMILGLRVVREDREPLEWSDLIFREVVGRFIHRVFWFTNLLYLFVAFGEQKQGLHDMFGNTRVVFDR
ncbi:RDD family protein [Lentibacillus salicampi]|uniref:RDD family protein n=1 Tax=Lentibacillus salicampi TaxID=175306 RepID=A0A4Y9AFT0_9BACI|nr:RDD family protein [Lentibacillus salicampi]TFJ93251.1 RDD family protein [Lentibacillus salicampi]